MTGALPPTSRRARVTEALATAAGGWVVARVLVLGALALAHHLVDEAGIRRAAVRAAVSAGLRGWDAAYYAEIARSGYGELGETAVRFFPLQAVAAKVASLGLVDPAWPSVVVANVAALAAGTLLVLLARREGADPALAGRAAWLLQLWPAAFVLVMGYAEALALTLALGTFLALRCRRWWAAAGLGLLAGLARPTGFLLALPALIEAVGGWRAAPRPERPARLAAIAGAPAGTAVYLAWVGARFGDPWLPYTVQTRADLKGEFSNPLATIADALGGLASGERVGTGLHVPWLALCVVLVVLGVRRWPRSYTVYAAAVLAVAAVSANLDSFERYALGAFPIVLTLAAVTADRHLERPVFVLAGGLLSSYALLAFLGAYVP